MPNSPDKPIPRPPTLPDGKRPGLDRARPEKPEMPAAPLGPL